MKKDIIISFVIPAYNSEKTIIRTLKSFNYEKKDNFEVIIVNDGSTDNTVKITNEWIKKNNLKDTINIFTKTNGNWGSVMNYASKIVKGKYIKIVDSDDEINKKTFNEILFFLKSKVPNDIDICAVPFTIYNENEQKNIQKRNGIFKRKPYILQLANKKLNFFIFTHHMLIFKKEIFINACPLVEKYFYSDNLLIFKTLVNTEKIYIFSKKIVSYKYYVGNQEQSISINNYINRREHVFNVYKKILETKIPKNISENKKKYIVDFIFNILYLLVLLTILDKKNTNVETNNIIDGYLQTTKQFKSKELILSSFYYKIICNKNLRTLLRIINKFIYKFAWFGFFKAIKS